jgi:hypothetical protein
VPCDVRRGGRLPGGSRPGYRPGLLRSLVRRELAGFDRRPWPATLSPSPKRRRGTTATRPPSGPPSLSGEGTRVRSQATNIAPPAPGTSIQPPQRTTRPGDCVSGPCGPTTNPYGFMTGPCGLTTNPGGFVARPCGPETNPYGFMTRPCGPTTNPCGFMAGPCGPTTHSCGSETKSWGPKARRDGGEGGAARRLAAAERRDPRTVGRGRPRADGRPGGGGLAVSWWVQLSRSSSPPGVGLGVNRGVLECTEEPVKALGLGADVFRPQRWARLIRRRKTRAARRTVRSSSLKTDAKPASRRSRNPRPAPADAVPFVGRRRLLFQRSSTLFYGRA